MESLWDCTVATVVLAIVSKILPPIFLFLYFRSHKKIILTCFHSKTYPNNDSMAPNKASSPSKSKTNVAKGKKTPAKATSNKNEDTAAIVLDYLFEMHGLGTIPVDEKQVLLQTGYARTDSTGYRMVMKTLIKETKQVVRSNKKLDLTETGLAYMQSRGGDSITSTRKVRTNEEVAESLKARIFKNVKAPKKAFDAIWNVLIDGKRHTQTELLAASDYKRNDSTGYREIMKWLKNTNAVQKDGKDFQFTDMLFPCGRP